MRISSPPCRSERRVYQTFEIGSNQRRQVNVYTCVRFLRSAIFLRFDKVRISRARTERIVQKTEISNPKLGISAVSMEPLNVWSLNPEVIANEMSNFAHLPFVLDGKSFASVEGFYVWLKWHGDQEKQAQAQKLFGLVAKEFGTASTNSHTEYMGAKFELGSTQHHELIKRAIRAKLEQHPDVAARFADTYPRPITHDVDVAEDPATRLPAETFCKMLEDLRQELVDRRL